MREFSNSQELEKTSKRGQLYCLKPDSELRAYIHVYLLRLSTGFVIFTDRHHGASEVFSYPESGFRDTDWMLCCDYKQ